MMIMALTPVLPISFIVADQAGHSRQSSQLPMRQQVIIWAILYPSQGTMLLLGLMGMMITALVPAQRIYLSIR